MGKTIETQTILDQRREQMLSVLEGGIGGEQGSYGDTSSSDSEQATDDSSESEQKDAAKNDTKANANGKPNAPRTTRKPPQQRIGTDNPLIQKALRKSTTQKTLRFPPMLIVEYEQACARKGIDPSFNAHMNEALELWLLKYGK